MLLADDPEVTHIQHHRSFLKEHVVFKEVTFGIKECDRNSVMRLSDEEVVSAQAFIYDFLFVGHTN